MLDAAKAERAMNSGLAAICAWCEHYWEASSQMSENHSGCIKHQCGGPLKHKAFPMYKGPWGSKEKYCFICGGASDAMVDIHYSGSIGVCTKHVEELKKLLAKKGKANVCERTVLAL